MQLGGVGAVDELRSSCRPFVRFDNSILLEPGPSLFEGGWPLGLLGCRIHPRLWRRVRGLTLLTATISSHSLRKNPPATLRNSRQAVGGRYVKAKSSGERARLSSSEGRRDSFWRWSEGVAPCFAGVASLVPSFVRPWG